MEKKVRLYRIYLVGHHEERASEGGRSGLVKAQPPIGVGSGVDVWQMGRQEGFVQPGDGGA